MKPAAIIYLITNSVNGKTYVGVTRFSIKKRWREHRYNALNRLKKTYLYSAIRKYGPESFVITPVASCLTTERDEIARIERLVIQTHAPAYNQTNGGEITVGKRVPREIVDRVIAKNKGLKRTPEARRRMSEAQKALLRENPEHLRNITQRLIGSNPEKRKRNRELVRAESTIKMAATKRRRYQEDPELRAKTLYALNKSERGATQRKPVECITLGVSFDSVSEAARHLNLQDSCISSVCLGKHKTAGGLRFQHI